MFDSLRYGAGRWIAIGLLVVLGGVGGYFAYTKVMNAAGGSSPAATTPTASASTDTTPTEGSGTEGNVTPTDSNTSETPGATPSVMPSGSQTQPEDSDPVNKPIVEVPVPKGGEQIKLMRGDAKKGEAFVYVVISESDIKTVAQFYKDNFKKEAWDVRIIEGDIIVFKITNLNWTGALQLRSVDGKILLAGVLKPIAE